LSAKKTESALLTEKKMKPRNTFEAFNACLEKAIEKEADAMNEIMVMLTPLIKHSIHQYFLAGMDEEDLLQEGYLTVTQCLSEFDPKKGVPFLGFIKSRLRFLYMDMGRKTNKEQCDSLNQTVNNLKEPVELIDLLPDPEASIDGELLHAEDLYWLHEALSVLSHREHQIIRLSFYEKKCLEDIARELGLTYRTVVNTKANGLNKLRDYWQKNRLD